MTFMIMTIITALIMTMAVWSIRNTADPTIVCVHLLDKECTKRILPLMMMMMIKRRTMMTMLMMTVTMMMMITRKMKLSGGHCRSLPLRMNIPPL